MSDVNQAKIFILNSFPCRFQVGDQVRYQYILYSSARVNLPQRVENRIDEAFIELVKDGYLNSDHELTKKGYIFLLNAR